MKKRKVPAGAKIFTCPVCGYQFKPMTDTQLRVAQINHQGSIRHQAALEQKDS